MFARVILNRSFLPFFCLSSLFSVLKRSAGVAQIRKVTLPIGCPYDFADISTIMRGER